jgi:hypothetical protein
MQNAGYQKIPGDATLEQALRASAGSAKLPTSDVTRISKFKSVNTQLQDIATTIGDESLITGPFAGTALNWNPYDQKYAVLRQQLQAVLPSLARGVFGEVGVLTDADMERYRKVLSDPSTPKNIAVEQINNLIDLTRREYEDSLDTLARSGYDVSNFGGVSLGGSTSGSSSGGNLGSARSALSDI